MAGNLDINRRRTIYLSGPMKGYPESNYPLFNRVAAELRAEGHRVYNPAEFSYCRVAHPTFPMRVAFAEYCAFICNEACTIALLPGWEKSLGVSAELALAKNCGLDVIEHPASPFEGSGRNRADATNDPASPSLSSLRKGAEVAVRKLRWSEPDASAAYPEWRAHEPSIKFSAVIDTSRALCFGKFPLTINGLTPEAKFETLDEAKAYAQANFETRIRSALVSGSREEPRS